MLSAPATVSVPEGRRSSTIRRISFCKVDTVGKRTLDLMTGLPQDGPKVSLPEPIWNPKEATAKNLNRANARNTIDGR